MADDSTPTDTISAESENTTNPSVGEDALDAARAIIAAEVADARADVLARSLRTLAQSVVAGAAVAAVHVYEAGNHDWHTIGWAAAQAAVTVVVTFLHGKIQPATQRGT